MSNCTNILINEVTVNNVPSGLSAFGFIFGLIVGFVIGFLLFWIFCFHYKFIHHHLNAYCFVHVGWSRGEVCFNEKVLRSASHCIKRKDRAVGADDRFSRGSRSNSATSLDALESPNRRSQSTNFTSDAADANAGGLSNFCLIAAAQLPLPDRGGEGDLPMIDAVVQSNEYAGEQQLTNQDLAATEQLERRLVQQRLTGFAQLCWLLLNSMVKQKLLSEEHCERLQLEQMERLQAMKLQLDEKISKELKEIESSKKLSLDEKISANSTACSNYASELANNLNSELSRLCRDTGRSADLDEPQLDSLLLRMKASAAKLEAELSRQRLRQSVRLEEALARRRLLLAEQKAAEEAVVYDAELQLQSAGHQLQELKERNVIGDSQKLLNSFKEQLLRQKEAFQKNFLQQQQSLTERMTKLRAKLAAEADEQFNEEFQRLVESVEAGSMTDEQQFLEQFSQLLTADADRRQRLTEQQDEKDCNQVALLRDDLQQEKLAGEAEAQEQLGKQLKMPVEDWGRVLDAHVRETAVLRKRRQKQQQQQLEKLEQKLLQRQAKLSDSLAAQDAELEAVSKRQELVLQKTLAFQLQMDESAKKQILDEHQRSMLALGNQLQLSKLKQEKQLESKIAQRKSRIGEIRQRQRDAELAAKDERQVERAEQEAQQQEAEQRRLLEAESRASRQQLRERLAAETEEAMKQQEQRIGAAIGHLQTGQARRKRIIDKQAELLNQLQEQVEAKLTDGERPSSASQLDQILHSHRNQVASLSEQRQREQEQHRQQLEEEMQRRQMERQEQVKEQVDLEERNATRALDDSGHGQSGRIARFVLEMSLDSKFRNSMLEMEQEMRLEMQRQQEELDRQMEQEMQQALLEQRKHLLSQLAKVSKIAKPELQRMVTEAGEAAGAGKKLTKRVTADIAAASADAVRDEREGFEDRPSLSRKGSRRSLSRNVSFDFNDA